MQRWLSESGQQPSFRPVSVLAYYIGRLCEEFPGRLPSEIWAEKMRLPEGLLEEIIESLAYGRAVQANAIDPKGWASSPMRTVAMEIENALAAEEIANG